MSYYAIGIGGTGAKCIEALTHLCGMGMLPKQDLYCLFVDPDRANGSLERATITLRQYQACQKLKIGDPSKVDMFGTDIAVGDPHVWSPFMSKQRPELADFFEYSSLRAKCPAAAHLFDVLYSEDEKKTSLDMGFRGHPSIGAAILARTVNLGEEEPWLTFRKKIEADTNAGHKVKIFLFSSIFGGTGASGFPTITRLIRNGLRPQEANLTTIGGALILPYFTFVPSNHKDVLHAAADHFLMNTQMALQYYRTQQKQHDIVYLLGESEPSPVTFSIGSTEQENDAHFIEFYAALAARDFYTRDEPKGYAMIARQDQEKIGWLDLPDGKNGTEIKNKTEHLTRFAFAYLNVFLKTLISIREKGKNYRAPWYIDYFKRAKIDLKDAETQKELAQVRDYCRSLLLWLAQIEISAKRQNIELVNYTTFASKEKKDEMNIVHLLHDFVNDEFGNLILPEAKERPNEISKVWEIMCGSKVKDVQAVGLGKFFRALYDACA